MALIYFTSPWPQVRPVTSIIDVISKTHQKKCQWQGFSRKHWKRSRTCSIVSHYEHLNCVCVWGGGNISVVAVNSVLSILHCCWGKELALSLRIKLSHVVHWPSAQTGRSCSLFILHISSVSPPSSFTSQCTLHFKWVISDSTFKILQNHQYRCYIIQELHFTPPNQHRQWKSPGYVLVHIWQTLCTN